MGELISDRPYEYILQRLRLVMANKTPVLQVIEVADEPDRVGPNEYPSIAVTTRILGFRLFNPVTGKALLPASWFKGYFESWPVQQAFLQAFAAFIAEHIPHDSPEISLKAKFKNINKGRASKLPARADLLFTYHELIRQLKAVKKWLREQPKGNSGFTAKDKNRLLDDAPRDWYWWLKFVEHEDLSLDEISSCTPAATALFILTMRYGSQEDAVRSRFLRPEK